MRIDAAAWPFIGGSLILAALAGWLSGLWAAAPFLALSAVFAFFFRDPERVVPQDPGLVLSPADGRVMVAGEPDGRLGPPGRWQQITIFLSPMDVHMNRTPVAGRVTRIEYRPGKFLPAYKEEAGENELNEIWIDYQGEPVVVRQIVGVLARRVVCRVTEGQTLDRGERIGLMKFGSRMDVFLPKRAELLVHVGQTVVAGETVLARLDPAGTGAL
jgi:phosphatidylserine decarboxylase